MVITHSEVIVVGAGPAGIAAAIAARRRGLRVTVLDARTPPIDKPCGEGILPRGVAALRALGVNLPPDFVYPFRGIQFGDGATAAHADFAGAAGLSVRRMKLHDILSRRAVKEGVEFRWGTRVNQLDHGIVATMSERFPYEWLIGADGQNSQVRKWAGLEAQAAPRKRFGFCRHYRVEPWSDAVEVHWARGCQMFVTPLVEREVGVVVFSRDPTLRLESALPQFPALAKKLQGATPTTREVGDTTSLRILPGVTRGRTALIGDASGTVDAVTGHGLSLSFEQAGQLADAMKDGDLSRYEAAHRKIAAVPIAMTRLMLLMERSDWIRRRALRLLQNTPGLFSRLLAIHSGAQPLSSVGLSEIADAGWKFLWA
jgi:menaquinone-9 beta-reductase